MYQHSLYTTHIVGQLGNAMNSYYLHVGGKITAIFYILSVVSHHGMSGPDGKMEILMVKRKQQMWL